MHGGKVLGKVALVVTAWGAAASGAEGPRKFELAIESSMVVQPPGRPTPAAAKELTRMDYSLATRSQVAEVSIEAMETKLWKDNVLSMSFFVSRDWARIRENGKDEEFSYDAAQPGLRRMMQEFGRPIATITLDAEGGELGRTIALDAGSALASNGVLENARMFHVRFPTAKDRWEAPATFTLGNGQYARGSLSYEKVAPAREAPPGGPVRVKVAGTLKVGEVKQGANTFKDGAYKVSGEQVYDPSAREWASGLLQVDASSVIESPGLPPGSARATMRVLMRRAPADSRPAVAGK